MTKSTEKQPDFPKWPPHYYDFSLGGSAGNGTSPHGRPKPKGLPSTKES